MDVVLLIKFSNVLFKLCQELKDRCLLAETVIISGSLSFVLKLGN